MRSALGVEGIQHQGVLCARCESIDQKIGSRIGLIVDSLLGRRGEDFEDKLLSEATVVTSCALHQQRAHRVVRDRTTHHGIRATCDGRKEGTQKERLS